MKTEQRKFTKKTNWEVLSDNKLKDKAQLVFVFGSTSLLKKAEYYKEIKKFYPKAHIVLATTSGEILDDVVSDDSIVVTAIFFESAKLQAKKVTITKAEDSFKLGKKLAASIEKKGLVHAVVLSDGLNVNGTELVHGLTSELPANVALTGGLAGDGSAFKETLVGLDQAPKKKVITIIGFYGDKLKIGYGSMGGWDNFGPERKITRSEGNILYELDGKPALKLYKEYLGDQAKDLPSSGLLFPLSLRSEDGGEDIVRTILAIDEKAQSLTFAGDIPQGAYGRLMKANFERLIDGAMNAANLTHKSLGGTSKPDFALLISCVGRKLVLKQRIDEEVVGVKKMLGKQATITGFYSYGEICPSTPTSKKCELHNQTMTITTFTEK